MEEAGEETSIKQRGVVFLSCTLSQTQELLTSYDAFGCPAPSIPIPIPIPFQCLQPPHPSLFNLSPILHLQNLQKPR